MNNKNNSKVFGDKEIDEKKANDNHTSIRILRIAATNQQIKRPGTKTSKIFSR